MYACFCGFAIGNVNSNFNKNLYCFLEHIYLNTRLYCWKRILFHLATFIQSHSSIFITGRNILTFVQKVEDSFKTRVISGSTLSELGVELQNKTSACTVDCVLNGAIVTAELQVMLGTLIDLWSLKVQIHPEKVHTSPATNDVKDTCYF